MTLLQIPPPSQTSFELNDYLMLHFGSPVIDHVSSTLLRPVKELMARPGKRIRGQMVEVGFQLANALQVPTSIKEAQLKVLVECMEHLHAGSLAVDDVQDGSKMRRGKPSLHLKYGLPTALNTGNWLHAHIHTHTHRYTHIHTCTPIYTHTHT